MSKCYSKLLTEAEVMSGRDKVGDLKRMKAELEVQLGIKIECFVGNLRYRHLFSSLVGA